MIWPRCIVLHLAVTGMPIIKTTMASAVWGNRCSSAAYKIQNTGCRFQGGVSFDSLYPSPGFLHAATRELRQLKCGEEYCRVPHRSECRWDSYRQFARTRTIAAKYNNYNGLAGRSLLSLPLFRFSLISSISNAHPDERRDSGEQRIVQASIIERTKLCHRKMFIDRIKR